MVDKTTIHKLKSKDVKRLVRLHRKVVSLSNAKVYGNNVVKEWLSQITFENVRNQLKVRSTSWYVLCIGNKIVGFCQFPVMEKLIYQLNIDPKYQGLGYGKRLYDFMEKKFLKAGVDCIELNSTINAKNFYEKQGFKVINQIKFKLIDSEMPMYKMKKNLKD